MAWRPHRSAPSPRGRAATEEGGHRELPLDTVECAVAAGLRGQRRGVSDVREGDGAARCGSAPGPAAGDAERGGVARAVGTRPAGQRDGCDLSLTCCGGVLWTRRGVSLRTRPTVNRIFRPVCARREGLSRGRCGRCGRQAVAVGAALG
jgi:hypothetical protein